MMFKWQSGCLDRKITKTTWTTSLLTWANASPAREQHPHLHLLRWVRGLVLGGSVVDDSDGSTSEGFLGGLRGLLSRGGCVVQVRWRVVQVGADGTGVFWWLFWKDCQKCHFLKKLAKKCICLAHDPLQNNQFTSYIWEKLRKCLRGETEKLSNIKKTV